MGWVNAEVTVFWKVGRSVPVEYFTSYVLLIVVRVKGFVRGAKDGRFLIPPTLNPNCPRANTLDAPNVTFS